MVSNKYLAVGLTVVMVFLLARSGWGVNAALGKDRELHALIVGVGRYQDTNIPALSRADRDAKDFYSFIKERENLFTKVNLTVLMNEEATRPNVVRGLRQNLGKADKDDIVIIYLSGHGLTEPDVANEFYFGTHDARLDNLFGTALLMNDTNLFKGIKSNNVLLLTDACHSGGFNPGLDRLIAKSANKFFSIFDGVQGRIAISSSRPEEESFEKLVFGNSIFTHFLLKGLRGAAVPDFGNGVVTVNDLYGYVRENTRLASQGLQNPQLYAAKGVAEATPAFLVPKSANPLEIKAQFFYEDEGKDIKPLTNDSVLKSGQNIGVAFRSQENSFVYIFWNDSGGHMGMLFPNPKLTENIPQVVAGKTYWLPSKEGERWYVLDDTPGTETIYFVASRNRNPKLEELTRSFSQPSAGVQAQAPEKSAPPQQRVASAPAQQIKPEAAQEIKRELSLMGFAQYSVPKGAQKASFSSKEEASRNLENRLRVSGAEAVFKVEFKHVAN